MTSNEDGYCSCYPGYWGANCSNECTGGAGDNVCNGHGTCNPVNGECSCDDRFTVNSTCMQCKTGYIGLDCSITIMKISTNMSGYYTASKTTGAMVVTFDGAHYNYNGLGEHILMQASTSTGNFFSVHIRNVIASSDGLSVAADAFAFTCGGHSLELYGGATSSSINSLILWDQKETDIFEPFRFSGTIKCERISLNHYRISSDNVDLRIDVEIVGRFIYTTLVVSRDVCRTSVGLLSSCNGDPYDDFLPQDSALLTTTGDKVTLSQATIHTVFGASFRVATASSLLSRRMQQSTLPAGTGLNFNGCSISTAAPLYTFSASDVTFEVRFKPASVSGHGVIYCYDQNMTGGMTTSFLIVNGHIAVDYADNTRMTNLQVEVGHWYMLSVVWQPTKNLLLVCLTHTDGIYYTAKITFSSSSISSSANVMSPGGRLTLGQWRGNVVDSERLRWDFHGIIDTFRIWNELLDTLKIKTNAWTLIEGVVNNWNFNEGGGSVAFDSAAGNDMHMVTFGQWTHATWVLSDVTLSIPDNIQLSAYVVLKSPRPWMVPLKVDAEHFCQRVVYNSSIVNLCGTFSSEIITAYYEQCVYDSVIGRDYQHTYSLMRVFLQRCGFLDNNTDWEPEAILCHFYSRLDMSWKGPSCDKQCVSGTWQSNECVCHKGFWGIHCEKRCSSNCAGIGCNTTDGQCHCAVNWNHACSDCADGWTGMDCSLALTNITNFTNNDSMCAIYSHASYLMFDGQSYTLDTAGEFVFLETEMLAVYVRQGPCGSTHSYCVTQIAVKVADDTIVIRAPYTSDINDYKVFVNSTVLDFAVTAFVNNVQLDKYPSSTLRIIVANGVKLIIRSYSNYLTLETTMQKDMCTKTTGLSGNCDANIDNDFPNDDKQFYHLSNLTAGLINTVCAMQWSVTLDVGFVYVYPTIDYIEPRKYTANGYSLYFNGTSVTSEPLHDVFDPASDFVTIELRFRMDSVTSCVLVGYTQDQVFSVGIDGTFRLTVDGDNYDMGITPTTGWQHLTIVYSKSTGVTTVYHVNQSGTVTMATLSININLFQDGGILCIGTEAPRMDTNTDVAEFVSTLTGQVDGLRLWNRQLSLEYVLQSSSRIVNAGYTHLSAQWTFVEGSGYTAVDSVDGKLLYISRDTGPLWVLSDAGVMVTSQSSGAVNGGVLPLPAPSNELRNLCSETILNIASHCSALGESVIQLFTRLCIADASRSPIRQAVVTTVMTYASYCNIMLKPPGLATELCSKEMDVDFSLQYMCLQRDHCRFGEVDVFTGQCVCDIGYWGTNCSAICPGGPVQPCNDRGHCNSKTGECECDTRWQDSSNCTECKEGWSGPDCSEFKFPNSGTQPSNNVTTVKPPVNETQIIDPQTAAIFGQGHVSTFGSRVVFTLAALGEFHLLRSIDLGIQVKTVGCYDQSICFEAVAVNYGAHNLVVRSGYTSEERPELWYNGKHVDSDNNNFVSDDFKVTHDTTFVVDAVVGAVAKLAVKQVHRYLSVTLVVSYTECNNQDSVLGNCGVGTVVTADSSEERWLVAGTESLFDVLYVSSSIGETNSTYGGGHCLSFDGESSVTSGVLNDVFHHTADLSLEFHMRTVSVSGVILSYGVTSSFSLYLDTTIKLYIEGVVYDTNMTVSLSQWCKVTVVWHVSSMFLSVYVTNERGVITMSDLYIKNHEFFKSGGSLVLGKTLTMNLGGVVGEIDEIAVWHKAFLYQDIQRAWMLNHQGKERDIAALWKFDEGEGATIQDLVSSSHLQWTVYSWSSHQPQWRYSEARLDVISCKKAFFFTDDGLAKSAKEKCIRMFAVLQPNCFDTVAQSVYTELCVQDVAASGKLDVSLHVVVTVADICMAAKHLHHWPAQSLCNEYASGMFPYFVGQDCDMKCYFGAIEVGVSESCHCHDGYWGSDCSRMCPGGHLNVCRYAAIIVICMLACLNECICLPACLPACTFVFCVCAHVHECVGVRILICMCKIGSFLKGNKLL